MDEAQRLCSRVTLLDKGAVIYSGDMNKIDNLENILSRANRFAACVMNKKKIKVIN